MPRNNRRVPSGADDDEDLTRLLSGFKRSETRRGSAWWVQPVSAASAQKTYRCPGCALEIEPGMAHLVIWRADGILGDASDLAARRHWHSHCWKVW